ncbi:MAG: ATP phosphoribosyltransferase regulatory subunit, partial [Alphaproteobacteria bacterium]|nr:ATP phosphoribosyltransferase regulatory subunit [Alphaproteobacteria bacterium]
AEIIGSDSVAAAVEIVSVGVAALHAAGIRDISLDLTMPDLVDMLSAGPLPLAPDKVDDVRVALDAKDAGRLAALGAEDYLPLIAAAGPFPEALAAFKSIKGCAALGERLAAIEAIAVEVGDAARITLDPTERHGFEYQSWIGFSLFGAGVSGEIGRGGSYTIIHPDGREEAAIGFSLYIDPLTGALAAQDESRRLFLPLGTTPQHAANLRAQGWVTVAALNAADDARALGCTYRLGADGPIALAR